MAWEKKLLIRLINAQKSISECKKIIIFPRRFISNSFIYKILCTCILQRENFLVQNWDKWNTINFISETRSRSRSKDKEQSKGPNVPIAIERTNLKEKI